MKKARILIVEDEELVALGIRLFLQSIGYEVLPLLSSGEETVERFGELSPDLVLMDIRLEGTMSGIEAAAALRTRYPVPVVFLTAYSDADTMRGARHVSPYGYILKPFDEQTLAAMIAVALRKSALQQELRERARRGTAGMMGDRSVEGSSGAPPVGGSAPWVPDAGLVEAGPLRMGGFLVPSAFGAGDRYGIFRIGDSQVGMYAVDVLDHGDTAGSQGRSLSELFTIQGARFATLDADPLVPRVVAEKLNDRLCQRDDHAYVSFGYGVFDGATRVLRLVVAGYPPPILQRRGGAIQEIQAQGFAAGVTPQFRVFEQEVTLSPGDRVFFFSDGLADCADAPSASCGDGRLITILGECKQRDLLDAIACIQRDVLQWDAVHPPLDDVSLMAVQAG